MALDFPNSPSTNMWDAQNLYRYFALGNPKETIAPNSKLNTKYPNEP